MLDIRTVTGVHERIGTSGTGRILVLSVGKSAFTMYDAFRGILEDQGTRMHPEGLVLSPYCGSSDHDPTIVLKGNHPIPGIADIDNTDRVRRFLRSASDQDMVVILLSGGSSSLLFSPREGISPEEKISIVRDLMTSGADIVEMNTVRTYLSSSKGGGLLESSGTDRIVTLAFSDVPDDDPRLIGSGPSYPWAPAREDVLDILERRDIDRRSIGIVSGLPEKKVTSVNKGRYLSIASSKTMVRSAADLLTSCGFRCSIDPDRFSGTAREVSRMLLARGRRSIGAPPSAFISAGESTVHVEGDGFGGRNLEMALSLVGGLNQDEEVLCMGTDGIDGTSDLAGAVVTADTPDADLARRYLENNDSGSFFSEFPGGIRTGPTGVNLGDLFLLLRRAPMNDHPHPLRP